MGLTRKYWIFLAVVAALVFLASFTVPAIVVFLSALGLACKYWICLAFVVAIVFLASFTVAAIVVIGGGKPFANVSDFSLTMRRMSFAFIFTIIVSVALPAVVSYFSHVFDHTRMRGVIKAHYEEFLSYCTNNPSKMGKLGQQALRVCCEDRDSLSNALVAIANQPTSISNGLLLVTNLPTNISNGMLLVTNLPTSLGSGLLLVTNLPTGLGSGLFLITNLPAKSPTVEITVVSYPKIELVSFYPYLFCSLNGMAPLLILCFGILLTAVWPVPEEARWWFLGARRLKGFLKTPTFWGWFLFSFFLFIVNGQSVWVRNFLPLNEGRFVYAYSNWDVSRWSFCVTEAVDTIYLMFIILVWAKWLAFLSEFKERPENERAFTYATNTKVLKRLSDLYVQWQLASVLIAVPYLGITFFYYEHILSDIHDHRYLPQAIFSHVFWAVTWIIVSLRLLKEHYEWTTSKMEALAECNLDRDRLEQMSKLFDTLRPYGTTNVIVSAFVGGLTFLAPAFHYILESFHLGPG